MSIEAHVWGPLSEGNSRGDECPDTTVITGVPAAAAAAADVAWLLEY